MTGLIYEAGDIMPFWPFKKKKKIEENPEPPKVEEKPKEPEPEEEPTNSWPEQPPEFMEALEAMTRNEQELCTGYLLRLSELINSTLDSYWHRNKVEYNLMVRITNAPNNALLKTIVDLTEIAIREGDITFETRK